MSIENVRTSHVEPSAYPVAQQENLTIRELPDETLVYDRKRHRMHCLNRTAALVWRHCDGQHDLTVLTAVVVDVLQLPEAEAAAATRLALEQLGRRELLVHGSITPLPEDQQADRRQALRRLVTLAASALPVVMTLRSPSVAWAVGQSCSDTNPCPPGEQCTAVTTYGPHSSLHTNYRCTREVTNTNTSSSSPPATTCTRTCNYGPSGFLVGAGTLSGCTPCNAAVCPDSSSPDSTQTITGNC